MKITRTLRATAALLALSLPGWAQTVEDQVLLVGDNVLQDFFGRRVAATEEWVVVTEPNDMIDHRLWWVTGTAFFFHREPGGFRLAQQVLPGDRFGDIGSGNFGRGAAIDGSIAVFGDPLSMVGAHWRGAAYVFEYRQDRWRDTARLVPDGMDSGDRFGWSVDVDGERILVCATAEKFGDIFTGAGYLFERVEGQWTKVAKLVAHDPASPPQGVGWACALSGDTAVLIERDTRVFIFERIAGEWRQTTFMWDPTGHFSHFGWSVDLDGDTLVVGAPTAPNVGAPGAIAVYERSAPGQWALHTLRNAPQWDIGGGIGTDRFGEDVAIHGDHILVGAPMAPDESGEYVGQAYLFERRPNKWKPIDRFTAAGAEEDTSFLGNAVALSTSFVVVADEVAEGKTAGVRSGVVYVYERALGVAYCPAELNSAGIGALLEIKGSLVAEAAALDLTATSLPRHEVGFFLVSRSEGFVPHPGGSDGNLCLGNPVARLSASLDTTGGAGVLEYTLESATIPLDPPDTIQSGESWSFQAWYRDRAAPGGSNFTDAVTVVFE